MGVEAVVDVMRSSILLRKVQIHDQESKRTELYGGYCRAAH